MGRILTTTFNYCGKQYDSQVVILSVPDGQLFQVTVHDEQILETLPDGKFTFVQGEDGKTKSINPESVAAIDLILCVIQSIQEQLQSKAE